MPQPPARAASSPKTGNRRPGRLKIWRNRCMDDSEWTDCLTDYLTQKYGFVMGLTRQGRYAARRSGGSCARYLRYENTNNHLDFRKKSSLLFFITLRSEIKPRLSEISLVCSARKGELASVSRQKRPVRDQIIAKFALASNYGFNIMILIS
jgi:hypothetical protein